MKEYGHKKRCTFWQTGQGCDCGVEEELMAEIDGFELREEVERLRKVKRDYCKLDKAVRAYLADIGIELTESASLIAVLNTLAVAARIGITGDAQA